MLIVEDIRDYFTEELKRGRFVTDKTGVKTIEMIGACFEANHPTIFGEVNDDYIQRELEWYKSMSLYVDDIPGKTPAIWEQVASSEGKINSNYGWAIYSEDNGLQYLNVLDELTANPNSRRAVMIYTRPTMWTDYNHNGMSDFMCTNAVQYMIRDGQLVAVVQMRSNDVWAGFRNDLAWQSYVADQLSNDLGLKVLPKIIWQVGNLHMYQKQFYLADHFGKTGELHISLADYKKRYPENIFC
jgi:thymidylate synthase